MLPITIKQNPAAQSATVVAASQSISGATALTLAAGASAIDTGVGGRIIEIVSAGNDAGITFTVVGVSANGLATSEVIIGTNAGTAVSTKFYSSITSITTSGSTASTVTVGTVNTTLSTTSVCVPLDVYQRVPTAISVQITGTINYTVLETFDPLLLDSSGVTVTPDAAIYQSITALAAKTATSHGQVDVGATGIQIQINSYSTGATLTARIISSSNAFIS